LGVSLIPPSIGGQGGTYTAPLSPPTPNLGRSPGSHQPLDGGEKFGNILARMNYEIIFAPEAVQDFKRLSARDRSIVRDAIEQHLRYEPEKTSKSWIKRLRGISRPQYRLRIGEIRVFYDVVGPDVEIMAIIPKSKAAAWLEEVGE